MKFRFTIVLAALFLASCAYTPPTTTYDRTNAFKVIGLVGGSFPTAVAADQPRTAQWNMVGGTPVIVEDNSAATRGRDPFATALSSIGYNPEVAFKRSLQERLSTAGLTAIPLDDIQRRRRVGLTSVTYEYSGNSEGADAYLDVQFVQWGYSSQRDQTSVRPYMLFTVRLSSTDGRQVYLSETIQYNDIGFAGFKTAIINGDPTMQFSTVEELVSNPEQAAKYMDKALDDIAREITLRLR